MTDLVIGNLDCPSKEIIQIVINNENPEQISTLWWTVASLLETPVEIKMKIQRKMEECMASEALQLLLIDWRSRVAENAKLFALIQILEKVGLQNCASVIRLRFAANANDKKPCGSFAPIEESKKPLLQFITQEHMPSSEKNLILATGTQWNTNEEWGRESHHRNRDVEASYGLCSKVQISSKLCSIKSGFIILIWLILLSVFFGALIYFFTMPGHQFTFRNKTLLGTAINSKCNPHSPLSSVNGLMDYESNGMQSRSNEYSDEHNSAGDDYSNTENVDYLNATPMAVIVC